MPEIIAKPKSWASRIYNLREGETLYFPIGNNNYIKSLISGWFKKKYPYNCYKVQSNPDNISVMRLKDLETKKV